MYSGKHRIIGLNVQIVCIHSGHLAWMSDPHDGTVHDVEALRRCGLLDVPATNLPDGTPPRHVGNKGYIELGMITPKRKYPTWHFIPTTGPITEPSTRSVTKSNESSPISKHGAS
ncbi:transposase family protein [Actinomyces naeslundii]|uniref:transposase family protein n=1 Tax=Actinomyces naeslundii TaxID=1655 RepID=UPI0030B92B01